MSNTTVQSLVVKLQSLQKRSQASLDFNSPNINTKERELRNLVKDNSIDDISYRVVATYFQNVYLNKFTVEELKLILSFDYTHLENTNVLDNSKSFDILNPPTDLNRSIKDFSESLYEVNTNHLKLLSVNKTRLISFFINYLLEQL